LGQERLLCRNPRGGSRQGLPIALESSLGDWLVVVVERTI